LRTDDDDDDNDDDDHHYNHHHGGSDGNDCEFGKHFIAFTGNVHLHRC
jgi:hypothetical protein